MTEINLIFLTDYWSEGYQLGINIILNKELSNARHSQLLEKIKYVFKNFHYGMDVAKISNILKIVLLNENINEEEIFDIRISTVNERRDLKTGPIMHVKRGILPYDIKEYGYTNDREVCIFRSINDNLTYYYHSDVNKSFTYTNNNNGIQFNYNNLPNTTRKRNGELNRFFKSNLDMLKKLENLNSEDIGKELYINHNIIITAYRLFYNEEPSFEDPDLITKMQCMTALLHMYVLPLIPPTTKTNYNEDGIITPESDYIKDKLLELYLITCKDKYNYISIFQFEKKVKENIQFLGKTINNYMNRLNAMDRIEFLNKFAVVSLKMHNTKDMKESQIIDSEIKELRLLLNKKDTKN